MPISPKILKPELLKKCQKQLTTNSMNNPNNCEQNNECLNTPCTSSTLTKSNLPKLQAICGCDAQIATSLTQNSQYTLSVLDVNCLHTITKTDQSQLNLSATPQLKIGCSLYIPKTGKC